MRPGRAGTSNKWFVPEGEEEEPAICVICDTPVSLQPVNKEAE